MIRNMNALQRAKFDQLKAKFEQYGVEVQPSFLRMEKALTNSVNHYEFDWQPAGADKATERKLQRNDMFYITSMLFGYIVTGETPGGESGAGAVYDESNSQIMTFPVSGSPALNSLYAGSMKITTGSKINIEAYPTMSFKYVPNNTLGTTAGVANGEGISEFNIEDASAATIADVVLFGTKSHTISMDFPAVPGGIIVPTTWTKPGNETISNPAVTLVLQFQGFLLKNGAIISQMTN